MNEGQLDRIEQNTCEILELLREKKKPKNDTRDKMEKLMNLPYQGS